MRDGWAKVTLGEIFEATSERLGRHDQEPPVLSLTKHDGVVRSADYFDRRIASARLDEYRVLRANDWAYSTIHIDEGAIARNRLGVDGVISPMYTTMRLRSGRVIPEYLDLALGADVMLAAYRSRAQGTVDRRRSLRYGAFAAIPVALPPLSEQRRVVDLGAAFDAAATGARVAERARASSRDLLRAAVNQVTEWKTIGDVITVAKAGGTPSRSDAVLWNGTVPWLKSGEVDQDGIAVTSESISEAGLAASAAWVMPPGTIVVAMYGQGQTAGTAGITAAPMACNQAVLGLVPDPQRVDPRFLFHWMRDRKEALRERRTGSTQPNLNKAIVLREPVPDLPLERQRKLARVLDALSLVAGCADAHSTTLATAKGVVIAELLAGRHALLAGYDRFLDGTS